LAKKRGLGPKGKGRPAGPWGGEESDAMLFGEGRDSLRRFSWPKAFMNEKEGRKKVAKRKGRGSGVAMKEKLGSSEEGEGAVFVEVFLALSLR